MMHILTLSRPEPVISGQPWINTRFNLEYRVFTLTGYPNVWYRIIEYSFSMRRYMFLSDLVGPIPAFWRAEWWSSALSKLSYEHVVVYPADLTETFEMHMTANKIVEALYHEGDNATFDVDHRCSSPYMEERWLWLQLHTHTQNQVPPRESGAGSDDDSQAARRPPSRSGSIEL